MKKISLTLFSFASALSLAHGTIPGQASEAIKVATQLFVSAQPKEVQRQFSSITATKTGHEQFDVVITLANQSNQFRYSCEENESVNPVVWECQLN